MLKNKYQRMNKQEKKEVRTKYYATEAGKIFKKRKNSLFIISLIGFIYSTGMFTYDFINNKLYTFSIACYVILFIASIIFLVGNIIILNKQFNKYAVKNVK